MGALEHSRYSPYALLITIGIEACAKHPLRLYVRMRKTPCYNGSRSGNSYVRNPFANYITCDMCQISLDVKFLIVTIETDAEASVGLNPIFV